MLVLYTHGTDQSILVAIKRLANVPALGWRALTRACETGHIVAFEYTSRPLSPVAGVEACANFSSGNHKEWGISGLSDFGLLHGGNGASPSSH